MAASAVALGRVVRPPAIPFGRWPVPMGPRHRHLMVRFDSGGEIRWMNGPARETLGPCSNVLSALTLARLPGLLSNFPLGEDWLWVAARTGDSPASLSDRLRQLSLSLWTVYHRRGLRHLDLLRAEGQIQSRCRRAAGRHPPSGSAADLIQALETERARIARELHDDTGQSMAGILLNLELVERHLSSAGAEVLARLARSKELASRALDQIRRISHQLHPPEWSEMDFPAAVEWLLESMGLRGKMHVEIGEIPSPKNISPAIQSVLYRTLQEGLTNVLRHSGAQRVVIRMPLSAEGLGLILEDDGRGFEAAAPQPARNGIGLANIRRRVESLGGRFKLDSAPGRGATLSVFIPLDQGGS